MTPACKHISEATDVLVEEFDALIDRHFAAERVIRVDSTDDGRYCAVIDESTIVGMPTPNLDTVIRLVRAFAIQTAGVTVDEDSVEYHRAERAFGHSVRVPPETCRCGRLISTFDCPYCGDGFNARRRKESSVVPIRTPA